MPTGSVNSNLLAQKSWHIVLGSDFTFVAWNRMFRYFTEIYYKQFSRLIPYQIDNVRIIYLGDNNSRGYAVGLDMKIHGSLFQELNRGQVYRLCKRKKILLMIFTIKRKWLANKSRTRLYTPTNRSKS